MKGLLTNEGYIVISVPHVGHNAICACLLNEDFDYRDWGLLDKTHIRFFGLKNMQAMFNKAGLAINHAEFVIVQPEESEFAESWKILSADMRKALSKNKFGSVYQVVIRASVSNSKNIELISLPVDMPATSTSRMLLFNLRRVAAKYLPSAVKTRIKRLLLKK